jgi:hypothetical protein
MVWKILTSGFVIAFLIVGLYVRLLPQEAELSWWRTILPS